MNGLLSSVTWGTWFDQDKDNNKKENYIDNKKLINRKQNMYRLNIEKDIPWFLELLQKFQSNKPIYSKNLLLSLYKNDIHYDNWNNVPSGIAPLDGLLISNDRRNRKEYQVQNLLAILHYLIREGDTIVEFCAGSGFIGLPLAYYFPKCKIILLDMKLLSLKIAEERIKKSKLKNITIFHGKIENYVEPFNIGIALHACGDASDMVQEKCLQHSAIYLLAPCCVGKIKNSLKIYPRSTSVRKQLTRDEYNVIAKAGDFNNIGNQMNQSKINQYRRKCKTFVEKDRNTLAQEAGYSTFLFLMHPPTATPKNDMLLGIPPVNNINKTSHKNYIFESLDKLKECEVKNII